ncbi:MAG: hypothetical protein IKA22_10000, partial [Lentisphaeria bacterium]|nr:hypothetical protein [Lentisphaeria bacterium]
NASYKPERSAGAVISHWATYYTDILKVNYFFFVTFFFQKKKVLVFCIAFAIYQSYQQDRRARQRNKMVMDIPIPLRRGNQPLQKECNNYLPSTGTGQI